MAIGDILAIAGIVLAAVGVAVAMYYGRKALSAERHKLSWRFESTPLISAQAGAYRESIDIRIAGDRLFDPHLLRLEIANKGRRDIDSSRFDQGRPLIFKLHNNKVAHAIDVGHPAVSMDSQSVQVGPELLRRNESWVVTMITERATEITLADNNLIDVEIASGQDLLEGRERVWALISILSTVGGIIAAILALIQIL